MLSESRLRRNTVYHLLDGIFYNVAAVAFSSDVIIPSMIRELTSSATLLGCVALVLSLGSMLPQLVYAKAVEGLPYKKPAVLLWVVAGRVAWLGFFASMFVRWSPHFTLTAFFLLLSVIALASGLLTSVWADWYARTTPEGGWGRVLGLRTAASGLAAITLGLFATWIMGRWGAPARYEILLGVALVFYLLSTLSLLPIKEERASGEPTHEGVHVFAYLRDLGRITFERRDFRRFMLAVLLTGQPMVLMGTFLASYGLSYPNVGRGLAGVFLICTGAAVSTGALLGGVLSDRRGPIAAIRLGSVIFLGAAAAATVSQRPVAVCIAFAVMGFSAGLRMTAMLPALFRFAGPYRRPSYIAASSIVTGLTAAVLPPIAGGLVDAGLIGLPAVFAAGGVMCLAGCLVFRGMRAPSAEEG